MSKAVSKHFRLSKSTKRLLALMDFPRDAKFSAEESKALKLENLSRNGFKSMMISAELSVDSTRISPLRDPLWKSKEKTTETIVVSEDTEKKTGRKGKKHRKLKESTIDNTPTV